MSKRMKNNLKFLSTMLVGGVSLLTVSLLSLGSSYREGLGEVSLGTGVHLLMASWAIGIIIFLLLLSFTIVERKANSLGVTLPKLVGAVVILFLSITYPLYVPTEPGYKQYSKGFLARVDRECNESEVRQWALDFMKTNKAKSSRDYVNDADSIPDFVRRIYPFEREPEFRWSIEKDDGHEYLSIYWGGALPGHWGIDIGQPDFLRTSNNRLYVLEWKPGIYVWHGVDW